MNKITDREFKVLFRRINNIIINNNNTAAGGSNAGGSNTGGSNTGSTNTNDDEDIILKQIKDDKYYLDIREQPPRFAYYRHVRREKLDEQRKEKIRNGHDIDTTITQDELDFILKRELRKSPEQRYQEEKEPWYWHELTYLHQTVDDNGKLIDVIKEYGCGHPDNSFTGSCVPECRFYPEYGRIEDEEVIEKHNKFVERHRQENAIIFIDLEDEETKKDYLEFLEDNPFLMK